MDRESGRCPYVDDEAEIVKPRDKTLRELGFVAPVEVVEAEVAIVRRVLEHVIGGREHRGGDGKDGLLRPAATLDAKELRSAVGVLRPSGGPGRLDEGGLKPRIARPRARGQAFASAFVQPGTEPGPRYEVSRA